MKKYILQWVICLAAMLWASGGMAQTKVTLTFQDASTQEIDVSESGKIYFSDDYMYIDDGTALPYSFALANIRKMTFGQGVGVSEIVPDAFKVYPNPVRDELYVSGNEFGPYHYTLYSIDGRLLLQGEVGNGETIPTGDIPAGLYILKINNTSLKINKL